MHTPDHICAPLPTRRDPPPLRGQTLLTLPREGVQRDPAVAAARERQAYFVLREKCALLGLHVPFE
jgi:hypothetical protein